MHYILEGRTPVPVDLMTWAIWFEDMANRRVALTTIGEATVSTVFLGLDHNFSGGTPILFETMIDGVSAESSWDHMSRYATWEEAERGHELAVEWVQSVIDLAGTKTDAFLSSMRKGAGAGA